MAIKEPEIGLDIEFRPNNAFPILTAILGDLSDAVEHQHRRQGQLRIARPKKLAVPAGDKIVIVEIRSP